VRQLGRGKQHDGLLGGLEQRAQRGELVEQRGRRDEPLGGLEQRAQRGELQGRGQQHDEPLGGQEQRAQRGELVEQRGRRDEQQGLRGGYCEPLRGGRQGEEDHEAQRGQGVRRALGREGACRTHPQELV